MPDPIKKPKNKESEEALLKHIKILRAINEYAVELTHLKHHDVYPLIVKRLKTIFDAKASWVSEYDEKVSDLVVKASSLTDDENGMATKLLGTQLAGYRVHVNEDQYRMMMGSSSATLSSLHELSLGAIPDILGKAVEKWFGIVWFMPVVLMAGDKIAGTAVIAGGSGQEAPNREEVLAFAAITANMLEQKRLELNLQYSENQYRNLFNGIKSGVAVYQAIDNGNDFVFKDFNQAAEAIDNDKRERLIGKSLLAMRPGIEKFGLLDVIRRVWRTGRAENHPITFYNDQQLSGWYENYIYKLPSGEVVAVFENITERKQAEQAVRESEAKFRAVVENSFDGIAFCDDAGRILYRSPSYARINGYSENEREGRNGFETVHPDDSAEIKELWQHVLQNPGKPLVAEFRTRHKDGSWRWLQSVAQNLLRNPDVNAVVIFSHDITERKDAELALQESQKKFQALVESTNDFIWEMDSRGNYTYCSPQMKALWGLNPKDMLGKSPFSLLPREDQDQAVKGFSALMVSASPIKNMEMRSLDGAGRVRQIEISGVPFFDVEGNLSGYRGVTRDVTERKQAEESLRESDLRFQAFVEQAPVAIGVWNLEGTGLYANRKCLDMLGLQGLKELIGRPATDFFAPQFREESRERTRRRMLALPVLPEYESVALRADGAQFPMHLWVAPIRLSDKTVSISFMTDITERIRAEQVLRETKERLELATSSANLGIWDWDIVNNKMVWDDQMFRLYGIAKKPANYGVEIWKKGLHSDDIAYAWDACQAAIRDKKPYDIEFRVQHSDGTVRYIKADGIVIRDNQGKAVRMLGVNYDITERKHSEETLHNVQKLESLGILAGGIAHDFNNLLAQIFGYIELAHKKSKDDKIKNYLGKSLNSMERAKDLTGQLMTFAKGGNPIKKIQSLFPFVQETTQFALSGSNVNARYEIEPNLWLCDFDQNQIGQVMDNVFINARQAMPMGGTIQLTANNIVLHEKEHSVLEKGEYVRISIKDSGIGIPKEILPRIFDPFFTTKTTGHGLGLATCFTILKRHGGCIDVESEQGKGSTFHVFLPALIGAVDSVTGAASTIHVGQGTFLLMDDEPGILETIAGMLESFGYSVVCRKNGQEALDFLAEETKANRAIAGMLFDLTIPGEMGGMEAVAEIRKINMDIKVFVTSGYSEDPVMANPHEYGFTASICKPFGMDKLSAMLNNHMKTGGGGKLSRNLSVY